MASTEDLYAKQPPLIKAALDIASTGLPVFPTNDKIPVWSNAELGVGRGEGGYKVATTDPDRVIELFSHPRAIEIAVPMGAMSGLLCIDVDLHKGPQVQQWLDDNQSWLRETRSHSTRSKGLHFIFRHVDNVRFPAQLAEGVDVKAGGAGYICWPGTPGYEVFGDVPVSKFPLDVLRSVMRDKGGSGSLSISSWNEATDEELIERIRSAEDLYPALRTLSMRLQSQQGPDGKPLRREHQVALLHSLLATSEAAAPTHPRHHDWLDRKRKVEDLVDSAIYKSEGVQMSDEVIASLLEGEPLMDVDAFTRPIGPQRETTPEDIEVRVAELDDGEVVDITAQSLSAERLPAIDWLVEQMIPLGGTVSLGGTSNVGKTRWLAGLCMCIAANCTERMGLPAAHAAEPVLWIANEEHVDDIKRRLKAAAQHYDIDETLPVSVRGKNEGMLRLIALNEVGTPEIDEDNVAKIVGWARRTGAKLIILDPYITLSDAMDENSANSAAMLTKAFLLITSMTGAALLHAHHTPKDRSKDADWYRADSGAWRGSGAIYSALDCGFTLANWMPAGGDDRKRWRRGMLDADLGRWIVLDTGKIREGKPLEPVVYELQGHELVDEKFEIGVCHLSDSVEAMNALSHAAIDTTLASLLAENILDAMGSGNHQASDVHDALRGSDGWPTDKDRLQTGHYNTLYDMFQQPVHTHAGSVQLDHDETKRTTGRWVFKCSAAC